MLITLLCLLPADGSLTVEQHVTVTSPHGLLRNIICKFLKVCLRQYGTAVSEQTDLGRITETHRTQRAV